MTLCLCEESFFSSFVDLFNSLVTFSDHLILDVRDDHVFDTDGDTGDSGESVTHSLNVIEEDSCSLEAVCSDALSDDLLELLLTESELELGLSIRILLLCCCSLGLLVSQSGEIDLKNEVVLRLCSVNKSEILRNDLVEDESSECGLNKTCLNLAVDLS